MAAISRRWSMFGSLHSGIPVNTMRPPFADDKPLARAAADPTCQVVLFCGLVPTGTTRTLTVQDADYTVAGLETAQTFTALNTFAVSPTAPFGVTGSNENERWGSGAGNSTTTATQSTAFGHGALANLAGGSTSSCFGHSAGAGLVNNGNATCLGYLTGGDSGNIVAVGHEALTGSSGATYSVAIGYLAAATGLTGTRTTAVGGFVGYSLQTGASNTLYGFAEGYNLTSGSNNCLFGHFPSPESILDTGSHNCAFGDAANFAAHDTQYAIALGDSATAASNEFALGPNINFFSPFGTGNYGSGSNVVYLKNGTAPSANPTRGGPLLVEAGSPKYRGTSGPVQTLNVAYNNLLGDGSDSSVTFDGTSTILGLVPSSSVYTLTRDLYTSALTVNTGVSIVTSNYRIHCT